MDRGNKLHVAFCASHGNIQAPFTADAVEGTEIVEKKPLFIEAVGDAKQNGIAFIALNGLEIFYKERLITVGTKEKSQCGVAKRRLRSKSSINDC